MSRQPTKAPSQRQLQVGENIRHALADIFMRGGIYYPNSMIEVYLLISEVRVSPDCRNATVFFQPMGSYPEGNLAKLLNEISDEVRLLLGKKIHIKHTPKLSFKQDISADNVDKINKLLS